MDANTSALNKYMKENERFERAQAHFDMDIKEYLQGMEDLYYEIRTLANDYDGYDLSDYAQETVQEVLGVAK